MGRSKDLVATYSKGIRTRFHHSTRSRMTIHLTFNSRLRTVRLSVKVRGRLNRRCLSLDDLHGQLHKIRDTSMMNSSWTMWESALFGCERTMCWVTWCAWACMLYCYGWCVVHKLCSGLGMYLMAWVFILTNVWCLKIDSIEFYRIVFFIIC